MTYIFITLAIILIWIVISYNSLIKKRNIVKEAWSGIDVQLKRRYDLIPNLVDSVKGYRDYEKNLLQKITDLRATAMNSISPGEKEKPESELSGMLMNFFAVAENYPDLKANQNFLDLQTKLSEVENEIQLARRYYNGAVRDYNIRVESFPTNIISTVFNFKKTEFFHIVLSSERETPEVNIS